MTKQLKIVGLVVAALVIIGLIVWAYTQQNLKMKLSGDKSPSLSETEYSLADLDPEASEATQALIRDSLALANGQEPMTIQVIDAEGEIGEDGQMKVREVQIVKVAPGTSGIDTTTGRVVDDQGKIISNEVPASGPGAPTPSFPLTEDQIPASAVKMQVNSRSFTPNEFTVNRGQVVNLALTNTNETTSAEIFRFDDPILKAVVIGVAHGETKSITFNAPVTAGEYTFYSDMAGHREMGAVGKMIVR